MLLWHKKRIRREEALKELHKSRENLEQAELVLQERIERHPDTLEKHAKMERVLKKNHIADLMFEALAEQRRKTE
jgi:hypothetical protein